MKKWLIRGVKLLLTVLVTWLIVYQVGLGLEAMSELDPSEWRPDPWLFLAASLLFLAGILYSGLLWGVVVRDLGGRSLTRREAVHIFLIANLGRYIPGKVWQVTGLAVLAKRRGIAASMSSFSAVVAHGVSLCAATLVGALVVVAAGPEHPGIRLLVPVGLAGLLVLGLSPPAFRQLLRVLGRLGVNLDWELLNPAVIVKWLLLFILHWVLFGASFLVLARSFGLPGEALEVIAAYVAAYVIGYLAIFAPAGLGVREASLAALLSASMGNAPAAGLAIVARVWSTLLEVGPAMLLWALEATRGRDGRPLRATEGSEDAE